MDGDSAAQHPTKAAFFMQHPVFALKMWSQSLLMSRNFLFDALPVRIMDPVKPFFWFVPDFSFFIAQHSLPTRREMHNVGRKIPVPQSIVRTTSRQCVTLFAFFQRFLCKLVRQLSTYSRYRDRKINRLRQIIVCP